ncbi:unnamed protein product [Symbiodinium sp. CCMP2592]|nr:unnamed protein product [Symbiodinium sp. CCMP2592]
MIRWLAVWLTLAATVSYKVSEAPIEIVSTDNETIKEKVEKIAAENLKEEFNEINGIPNPENVTSNSSNATHGFGELGRNFEFMMLKLAQLETLCELQQVEIESLKKTVKGLAEHVDHQDSVVSLVQKDESARVQEAQHTLKRVLAKHARQHKTKEFHPTLARQGRHETKTEARAEGSRRADSSGPLKATSQAQAMLLKRGKTTKADMGSLDSSLSAKGVPIVDEVKDFVEDRVEDVKSVAESTADAYEQAVDKVAFIAQTTIDTVEMAVQILLKGFTDWSAGCEDPVWPSIEFFDWTLINLGAGIYAQFGYQSCWVRLMGEKITLFEFNFGHKVLKWPEPISKMIRLGKDIADCEGGNVFKCLSNKIVEEIPPLDAMVSHCSGRNLFECFGNKIVGKVPPLNAMVSMGRDLATCFGGTEPIELFKCMGTRIAENVPPLNRMVTLGRDLVNCAEGSEPLDLIKCFGFRLLKEVPPLNFLSRLGDIFAEFIDTFAKVATTVVKTAMKHGFSLVQTAATSKFPEAGAPPAIHHAGKNLVIKTHSQHAMPASHLEARARRASTRMSVLQQHANASLAAGGDDDDEASAAVRGEAAISLQVGPYGPETTELITQFDAKETDTGSCLAFAPRTKTGQNGQATEKDWQVDSDDKFIQLEPWAVPCDNSWMQKNWDKWQGYTFYTARSNIEKCLTVTFSMGVQPVVAFVGGVQLDLLPTPLVQLDTQICWPKHHPGGVDISVLRTEIRTAGILLFSRTMRLAKRFGDHTSFSGRNLNKGFESFRSQFGLDWARSTSESGSGIYKMKRTTPQLLETNSSLKQDKADVEAELQWVDAEDLYMASVEYGEHMSVNKTSELRGSAAHRRMSMMQSQSGQSQSEPESYKLFGFKKPGKVNFDFQGLLTGNTLELQVKMGFGPFESPAQRIPLLNIVDQFSALLHALPFVSKGSRGKAEEALSDFSEKDVGKVEKHAFPGGIVPGTMVAIYSRAWRRFIKLRDNGVVESSPVVSSAVMPEAWGWERFTVVDAGNGQIALHSCYNNRFVQMGAHAPKGSGHHSARIPDSMTYEKFTVVDGGNGEVALYSEAFEKFLRMNGDKLDTSPTTSSQLHPGWAWERFQFVTLQPWFEPGSTIALHNTHHNRFIRMRPNGNLDGSPESSTYQPGWRWELFIVVDAGFGEIALYSPDHLRYVAMHSGAAGPTMGSTKAVFGSQPGPEERFAVRRVSGEFGLHCSVHNRFITMEGTTIRPTAGQFSFSHLNAVHTWERFRIVKVEDAPTHVETSKQSWTYDA